VIKSDTDGEMVEEAEEGWQAFPLRSFQVCLETWRAFSQSNRFTAYSCDGKLWKCTYLA